jgi:hypothetical protein
MFENEPDKRKQIINDLKEFTDNGDMYKLASSLNDVLRTPQQRLILGQIKPFIPLRQQALFDHLTTKSSSSLIINPNSLNINRDSPEPPAAPPPIELAYLKKKSLDFNLKSDSENSESIPSGVR